MSEKLESVINYPEIVKRLQSMFPDSLSDEVSAILALIPTTRFVLSPDNICTVVIYGEEIHIPYRIYFPEPGETLLNGLNDLELTILACIYTRHHDGLVRLKYLNRLLTVNEAWVSPFVLQLTGEYVIEIIETVSQNIELLPFELYAKFIAENQLFIDVLKQKIISYWNCYYRYRSFHFKDYVGFKLADKLGMWKKGEIKHLLAR
jgi:hypothetical protein